MAPNYSGYNQSGTAIPGSFGQTAVAGDRVPQVESAVSTLDCASESLAKSVSELEQRLAIVLQPCAPSPAVPSQQPREVVVPLAERINALVSRISSIQDQVRSVNQRLEL